MKKYHFNNNEWKNDFDYVYSPIVKNYPEFKNENGCLVNCYNKSVGDYEYISIVSKEMYDKAKITACCDFHKYGAPLIVFGDDISEKIGKDGKPHLFYGVHFEVVAWEEGCNIWHLQPDGNNDERPVKPTLLLGAKFHVEADEKIMLSVELCENTVYVDINGNKCSVECDKFPKHFHIGYTACEGINKLYELNIE